MNPYVTGTVIKSLREKNGLTQAGLAQLLCVSDKTVSKWETCKGYPDISLMEPLAAALHISVTELMAGETVCNQNRSANVLRAQFYVCPVCGNVICSMGELECHCHGIRLCPLHAEEPEEGHRAEISRVEDELFVSVPHEMTKRHYLSFLAAVSPDRIQLVKTYPEGNAEARFAMAGVRYICYYCNRDGLFCLNLTGRQDTHGARRDTIRRP